LSLEFGPPGHRLPKGFKTFDYFDPETGMATSQKSMDLARHYAKADNITRTGRRAINDIIDFEGYARSGVRLTPDQIRIRRLDITIPRGVATEAQQEALRQVRAYGLDNNVMVRIVEVK
jgi:filamentous hemagglutinin